MSKGKKKTKAKVSAPKVRQPSADKLLQKMSSVVRAKVIDLAAVREGKKQAQSLQESVADSDDLAHLHPGHAI
jgi:hypothetical protein